MPLFYGRKAQVSRLFYLICKLNMQLYKIMFMKKTIFIFLGLIVAFSSLFISCNDDDITNNDKNFVVCNISIRSTGDGTVCFNNFAEAIMVVLSGTDVTVIATPNDDCGFIGWFIEESETPISTDATYTFTVSQNLSLIAKFSKHPVVSISSTEYGSVSFDDSSEVSKVILPGTDVTVIATPNENCDFIGWFIEENETPISIDATYTFTVIENISLIARFSRSKSACPILLEVGKGITTRGTGAVGDTVGTGKIWHGESLNVYMFNKESLVLATENDGTPIFENTIVMTPKTTDIKQNESVVYADYETAYGVKYYPVEGNYDFFAYHADDAATGIPYLDTDANQYLLPVTINGTQDLMVSKAVLTNEQKSLLGYNSEDYYSAYAACNEVQPNFKFEHLLSRMKFFATPNAAKDTTIRVEAIKILGKDYEKANGTLVNGAYTDAEMVIAWSGEKPTTLFKKPTNPNATDIQLMDKVSDIDGTAQSLVALQPFAPIWDNVTGKGIKTQVGESMLLFPAESYVMEITLSQNMAKAGEPDLIFTNKLYNELKLPYGTSFKAGNQYNLNFTIFGLESVRIEIEFIPWNYIEGDDDVEIQDDIEF